MQPKRSSRGQRTCTMNDGTFTMWDSAPVPLSAVQGSAHVFCADTTQHTWAVTGVCEALGEALCNVTALDEISLCAVYVNWRFGVLDLVSINTGFMSSTSQHAPTPTPNAAGYPHRTVGPSVPWLPGEVQGRFPLDRGEAASFLTPSSVSWGNRVLYSAIQREQRRAHARTTHRQETCHRPPAREDWVTHCSKCNPPLLQSSRNPHCHSPNRSYTRPHQTACIPASLRAHLKPRHAQTGGPRPRCARSDRGRTLV
jgi:hypothetical protein